MTDTTSPILIHVPTEMTEAVDKIAGALQRDRSWVLLRALERYVHGEGGDVLREVEGLGALDRGEGMDFDAVLEEAEEIVRRAKAKHSS